jgi:hypothetical protein
MDDSSQNNPGIPQKPTTENTFGYPEYPVPTPASQPRKRRGFFIFAAAVLALLVLVSAVLLITGKKSCTTEQCFTQHFSMCSPAAYTYSESVSSVRYTIIGSRDVGCAVRVQYLKSKYVADTAGKEMTCNFDNRKNFQTAAQNVFHYPADYNCKGDLASLF